MKENEEIVFDNLVLSCAYEKYKAYEEFVPEHFLAIQLSGETGIQIGEKTFLYKKGDVILVRKNQVMRSVKVPGKNGEYKSILIFLNQDVLRKYSAQHKITGVERYPWESILGIKTDSFLKGYFDSLLPYVNNSVKKSHSLSDLKIYEAVELLLRQNPKLKTFLFDFHEPFKPDIEKYMLRNFMFNIPVIQFAKLTGRSVATFKRDFKAAFGQSPRGWLLQKRLSEAYRLIKEKRQNPADIYLEIGFENLSHFYYSFKKKYGVTPSELKTSKQKLNGNRTNPEE